MNIIVILCFCVTLELGKASIPQSPSPSNLGDEDDENDEFYEKTTVMPQTTPLDDASKLRKYYLECIAQTRVKPELVRKFRSGSWDENVHIKRWALCVLNKLDLMSLQGVFRYDTAMSKIQNEDKIFADKIIDRCLTDKPLRPIDIAWNYLKCHSKKDRKHYLPTLGIRLDKYNMPTLP